MDSKVHIDNKELSMIASSKKELFLKLQSSFTNYISNQEAKGIFVEFCLS